MGGVEKWSTVSSRLVFHRRHVRIAEDTVRLPGGEVTDYLVLRGGPGVAVLAVTDDRQLVLARQYRHPVGEVVDGLPGGGTERGESLAAAARRELREEVGLEAEEVVPLGSFLPSPARATTVVHVFLARQLRVVPASHEATEEIETCYVPWEEALDRVLRNEIRDVTAVFAILMAAQRGLV